MPVAVPTGRYDLEASIDLKPVLGRIEHLGAIDLVIPSKKILEERLAQLESGIVNTRRAALVDLRHFPEDGETVFPKLMACLEDEDAGIRMLALSVMTAYPTRAAEQADRFIGILTGDESVSTSEKANAAYLLSRFAPVSEKVGAALEQALAEADDSLKTRLKYAVENYRRRVAPPDPEERDDEASKSEE